MNYDERINLRIKSLEIAIKIADRWDNTQSLIQIGETIYNYLAENVAVTEN